MELKPEPGHVGETTSVVSKTLREMLVVQEGYCYHSGAARKKGTHHSSQGERMWLFTAHHSLEVQVAGAIT